jgi:hypothetical protein
MQSRWVGYFNEVLVDNTLVTEVVGTQVDFSDGRSGFIVSSRIDGTRAKYTIVIGDDVPHERMTFPSAIRIKLDIENPAHRRVFARMQQLANEASLIRMRKESAEADPHAQRLVLHKSNSEFDQKFDLIPQDSYEDMEWVRAVAFQVSEGLEIRNEDLEYLEGLGQYGLIGHIRIAKFLQWGDFWEAARACSVWRRAGLSEKACKYFDPIAESERRLDEGFAALLTSLGGAFRDIGDLVNAERKAGQSLQMGIRLGKEKSHPHNLLGALCLQTDRMSEGEEHFSRAIDLGAPLRDIEREFRSAFDQWDDQQRSEAASYLLKKDRRKYGWAEKYVRQEYPY